MILKRVNEVGEVAVFVEDGEVVLAGWIGEVDNVGEVCVLVRLACF